MGFKKVLEGAGRSSSCCAMAKVPFSLLFLLVLG